MKYDISSKEAQTAAFKHWVNGQNVFKSNFQKLPAQTNSDELFETITKILECATPIVVNRNNIEGILTQIEFDATIEEEKPFLKNLFDFISKGLTKGEIISNIQHLEYRERYTMDNNGRSCIIDFEYDKSRFFRSSASIRKRNVAAPISRQNQIHCKQPKRS